MGLEILKTIFADPISYGVIGSVIVALLWCVKLFVFKKFDFIEVLFLLERIYCFMGGRYVEVTEEVDEFESASLKQAVFFIENHYNEPITLQDIVRSCSVNHSTLTALFKEELGITPVAYLWHYRLLIAKKLLEFTNLPVKEIGKRCGFKTVQHFSRKFEEQLGLSPAVFRTQAIARRKASF